MDNGWIKIYAKLKEWQWYGEPIMVAFWIHILISANWKDKKWRGITIGRGQLVTSRTRLADEIGISEQQVRTCIERLISTNEIEVKATNKYTLITICKYDSYQVLEQDKQPTNNQQITNKQPTNNQQITNKQPTNNQQTTTTEEYIEEKEYKEKEEEKENLVVVEGVREENFETPEEILEEKEKDCAEKEKELFRVIEDVRTQNAGLIMMRKGWNAVDYANAVTDFRMTCEADGITHDSEAHIQNHFRNWVERRYRNGDRPLSPGNAMQRPTPTNQNDIAFDDFYRSKFDTGFVWQKSTSEEIQSIADAISSKISESGNSVIPSEMPNNIKAFLSKAWSLGDTWLQEHFTPKNIANQFNVIYGYIKSGKKPSNGKQNTPFGVSDDYLAKIQREILGGV